MESGTTVDEVPKTVTVRAENIGGIDETSVTLDRGITALTGRNATNRTSLLQAIMAALGSDQVSLKADADTGHASIKIGDDVYDRSLERSGTAIVTDGDPYLKDSEIADLFAFLLESNEARRAVARGDDLRELIMRPVDTTAIQSEIDERTEEKRRIDDRLSELDDISAKLPGLEEQRTRLDAEIEELESELADIEANIDDVDADVETSRAEKQELESKLDELQSVRSERERTRRRIDTERESINALESEHEELESELAELPEDRDAELQQLRSEIEMLEGRKESLTAEISQLQNTIQFNEERLADAQAGELDAGSSDTDSDLTDQLLSEQDSVVCWTCGSEVAREQIETTVEQLQSRRKEKLKERTDVSDQLRERRQEADQLESTRSEVDELERRIEQVEDEIEDRTDRLEDYEEQLDELADAVEQLESEVEELESESYEEVLDKHREANSIEFEIEQKEQKRREITEEIEDIESRLDERDSLETRRDEVAEALTELRTRIDRIEADAVEAFNEHMERLLELLGYDNLDRIWIQRNEREVREGRRKVTKSTFDLKIIRTTDDGTAYEDDINHLSESEREVTGLVFALAGYLVHDVYETVPFMLLDSLEAIDSNRIADLIAYFREYAPYLVVALLFEDADALDIDHERVTDI
ncbi:archaea-specific SMC-related protein [Natranaeroarchaeum sulfidigenes]|uniref:DNA sulfur modification protein DndD, ATPase n=1 Tax=Natranaeroarchaeum sulfidigenes TaxID=2784880 RepID=A0A897MRR9_9EURY|nr:archaea-specific SMC-related protein [Natranaeroarchaeum sulfidigenes]QSG03001.1 DNA sulfur modification protein DndD, ATPase [Natranaeroarchaeum sulfidigenes]